MKSLKDKSFKLGFVPFRSSTEILAKAKNGTIPKKGMVISMKKLFNITTDYYDLARFENQDEFLDLLTGFYGVELMYMGEDKNKIIENKHVIGFHSRTFPCWVDMWNGNKSALINEFLSEKDLRKYYGGDSREVITEGLKNELQRALDYGAEYIVFHIADSGITESLTRNFIHTDDEVIKASCELINMVFHDQPVTLLIENLWYPGFRFTSPEKTAQILNSINHKNTGIMLDTGHLLHNNTSVKSQEEGILYIHKMLDAHGELCKFIRGIHLNQSTTGKYAEKVKKNPPVFADTFSERVAQLYNYIFKIDLHRPFTCNGVKELIERISPDYLTFEFITNDLEEHKKFLNMQKEALKK